MEGRSHTVSDLPAPAGIGERAPNTPELFSFAWLEGVIVKNAPPDDEPITNKLNGYAFIAVILFGALGALGALLLRNQTGALILQIGIVLQWLCIAAALVNIGWRAWLAYRHQHEAFARDLDHQMVSYNAIVNTVSRYPQLAIRTHLRYVQVRKSRLIYRAGLFSGGFDKLGVLPLLLAMYLQFKDWTFGNWKAVLDHMHWLGVALLPFLLATYLVSWWAARAKGRLDLYEMLLAEASVREEGKREGHEGFQR